jgi:poly-beta-hydroxyalkanoate depolymerase
MEALLSLTLFPVACFGYAYYASRKSWRAYQEELRLREMRQHDLALAEARRPITYANPAEPTTADGWARRLAADFEGADRFTRSEERRSYEIGRFTDDDDDLEDYDY